MTTEEIQNRIEHIKEIAGDNEEAHVEQDNLMRDFIRYVATFESPIATKAKLVLTVGDIEFERWFA